MSGTDRLSLSAKAGSRISDLVVAVIVQPCADHDRANVVTIGECIREAFEHHNAHAAADNRPLRVRVERPAMSVRREYRSSRIEIADRKSTRLNSSHLVI